MAESDPTEAGTSVHTRRSRWFTIGLPALVLLSGIGAWGVIQWRAFVNPANQTVAFSAPAAPTLAARGGETIYRIDPGRSSASYSIEEKIVGRSAGTATGRTQAIAGDVALDPGHADAARLGPIVVNVEQLTSDESLRDARIRNSYLESHQHPLATVTTSEITGLPARAVPDRTYPIELRGTLALHATTRSTTWKAQVRLHDGRLYATGTTTIRLTEFGVGPISIAGLVSTSDTATISIILVAVDPTREPIQTTRRVPKSKLANSSSQVSFSRRIAPILAANCASCHTTGQIGADHWKLDTAGDAADTADGLALVTGNRYMPPWPAGGLSPHFRFDRSLTKDQIDAIAAWARAGGPLDVPRDEPVKPAKVDEPKIRSDITMQMTERYRPDPNVQNDYRCFLVDPKVAASTLVTGIEFLPDKLELVHHALIYRVSGQKLADALAADHADPTPGWNCTNDAVPLPVGPSDKRPERALINTWVPGSRPETFEPHRGFQFEAGDQVLSMQIHYHVHNADEIGAGDRSSVVFQTEAPTAATHALITAVAAAPVELPCPAGATGPLCNRDAELAELNREYGPAGALVQAGLQGLCRNGTTSDPATGNGTSRCDQPISLNGTIVNVIGHMHTRGAAIRLTLNPGTDRERVLLDIPRWSFGWQLTYEPVTPPAVHAGDTLRIECRWDRSQIVDPAPRYILFAEGTEDEMCFGTYTIDPSAPPS